MQKLSIIIAANHSHYICSRHLMIKMNSHKKCPTYYETYFISLSAKFISDRYTDDPKWLRNWTIWSKVVEDYFPCFLKDGFWLIGLKSSRTYLPSIWKKNHWFWNNFTFLKIIWSSVWNVRLLGNIYLNKLSKHRFLTDFSRQVLNYTYLFTFWIFKILSSRYI